MEWPTALLAVGVYGLWATVVAAYGTVPTWILAPAGAVLVTLHGSLQHEILHGHPTRSRRLNTAVGSIPLSLWLPFARYRQTHLLHHLDDRLTDPLDDPESYYWTDEDWRRLGPVGRGLVEAQTTLAGRVLIGPFWSIGRFLLDEAGRVRRGEPGARRTWAVHLAWCVPVVLWVTVVGGMPLWLYVATMVLPGTAILLVRSFAEHKAAPEASERVAIVENARILGPLFLFNNLHVVHHTRPGLAWYRIPGFYRRHRANFIRRNNGYVYRSYGEIFRLYFLRPKEPVAHPFVV